MTKTLDRMTKAELLAVIERKDAELGALRAKLSVASAPVATGRPAWLAECEARREAMARSKAEALRTGHTVKADLHV